MASVALVKYHYDTRVAYGFYLVAVPCLADGGIEFLNGGDDYLGIAVQPFHKFVCVVCTVHCTRLKGIIFRLGLCIEVVAVNHKHYLIHIVKFGNKLCCLKRGQGLSGSS